MPLIIPASQTLVAGEQIIALSSNDWDYTFDGGGEWNTAGNALGDHDEGGYVYNTGGDSAISSLITLDGDFEIEWTMADVNNASFGVHAIDEDATRATADRVAMSSMTNSFWYREESVTDFHIGATAQSDTHTFANGSVIKIERISGTIKMYDDDVEVHSFSTTYSGTMRFGIGAPGSPFDSDYDNIKITDSEKVQRDGFFNEGGASSNSQGDANTYRETGFLFTATRSGTVTGVKWHVASFGNSYTAHTEIWGHDGTNPTSQIGSDSDTVNLNSTGDKQFTLTDPVVEKGKQYWAICFDNELNGSGDVAFSKVADLGAGFGSGRHDTPTSITDNVTDDWKCEIEIDTSAGEPTPDHNTVLLLQSDTSDGSTTFTDSSQFARTDTVLGNTQHDTAQKKFGASSILFDGSGDGLTYTDSSDWQPSTGNFTIDFWVRFASVGAKAALLNHQTSGAAADQDWSLQLDSGDKLELYCHDDASSAGGVRSTTSMVVDTWYHIACVWRAGSMYLAVDGTFEASKTNLNYVGQDLADTLDIGTSDDGAVGDLDGWMDEIRISNVARWDDDFTPPTSPYPTA